MNGVKSLAQTVVVRALPRARSTAMVRASSTTTKAKGYAGQAARLGAARGIASSTCPLHLPERSFQATYYQDHVPAYSVPDIVVDELDPRNFGYRVVDLNNNAMSAPYYEEDYDLYSLHVSPTQVTCTSYYVDVLGDDLPQLPVSGNSTGGDGPVQSHGDAREDFGGIEEESSPSLPVTDEDGEG